MKNRIFILLALLFLQVGVGSAQITEGFESPNCPNYSRAFFVGCVNNWINTSGTADTRSVFAGVPTPPEGARYAHMYSKYKWSSTCPTFERGETVALNEQFQAGTSYTLDYQVFWRSGSGQCHRFAVEWFLTDGLVNQAGGNGCHPNEVIPPVQSTDQLISSFPVVGGLSAWESRSVTFTPTSNYSQLWCRPKVTLNQGCAPNSEATHHIFIDDFQLTTNTCQNSATSAVWPQDCILADADFSGNISLCPGATVVGVGLQFLQDNALVGSTIPVDDFDQTSWSIDLTLSGDLVEINGMEYGASYDMRPFFILSDGTIFIADQVNPGLNDDLTLGDVSNPEVTVNTNPNSPFPQMSQFCDDDPIWFYGMEDLISDRYHPSLKGRPIGWTNWTWEGHLPVFDPFGDDTGDLRTMFTILQSGWEYEFIVGTSNPAECRAWSRTSVFFEVVDCSACVNIQHVPNFTTSISGNTVTLTDNSSSNSSNNPQVRIQWGENGNGTSIPLGGSASYTYSQPGPYEICLSVVSNEGDVECSETVCSTIVIPTGITCDDVNFLFSMQDFLCSIVAQVFVTDPSITILNVNWQWAPGIFTQGQSTAFQYTFTPPDFIIVRVRVRLPDGTICDLQQIQPICMPNCKLQPGCLSNSDKAAANNNWDKAWTNEGTTPSFTNLDQLENAIEIQSDEQVTITAYPVPTSHSITFDIVSIDGQPGTINLYDLNGKLLKQTSINGQRSVEVDLSEIAPGIYFYNFQQQNNQPTGMQKLVIVR